MMIRRLDRLLMASGSQAMAHGSWLIAKAGWPRGSPGEGLDAGARPAFMCHEQLTINNQLINRLLITILFQLLRY